MIGIFPAIAYADCSSPAGIEGRIDYTSTATEKVFKYCNGADWVPWAGEPVTGAPAPTAGFSLNLDELLDVTLGSPANGECLTYNGSAWVDGSCGGAGGSGYSAAVVATSETRNATSYADLTTAGPAVTVTTGTAALVTLTAKMSNGTAGSGCKMGFAVSGATTVAAGDTQALWETSAANYAYQVSATFYVTGLTAGSNTFTAKYSTHTSGTCTFVNRGIIVDTGAGGSGGSGSSLWSQNGSDIYYNSGKVGIGTAAPSLNFEVVNSADTAYQRIAGQGDAWNYSVVYIGNTVDSKKWSLNFRKYAGAQNDLGFEYYDGATFNKYVTFTSAGNVGIGTATPYLTSLSPPNTSTDIRLQTYGAQTAVNAGLHPVLYSELRIAPSADQPTGKWNAGGRESAAVTAYAAIPGGNTKRVNRAHGVQGLAENYGTGNVEYMQGVLGWAYNTSNATVGSISGIGAYSESDAGTVSKLNGIDVWSGVYGGTVTNHYGIYINLDKVGGTVTNRYGILIDPFESSANTNDYGLYIAATQPSYFAGNVGIGDATPDARLDVAGTLQIDYGGEACDAAREGALHYNSATDKFFGCKTAGAWAELAAGGGSSALSGLTAAAATNWINNANFAQGWSWSTLNTQTALQLGANALTSGKILYVSSSATGFTAAGTMIEALLSGNNAANTGTLIKSTVSGASSAAVPLMVTNLGTGASFRVNDQTGDADTTPFIIDNAGNVGIGDPAPSVALDVVGDINYTGVIVDVSDRSVKENIGPLSGSLEKIAALRGVSFTMKGDPAGKTELGFIAQDVEPVFPELVLTGDDGLKALNYVGMIAPLAEAIRELKAENEALRARIEALEARNAQPGGPQ